MLVNQRRAEDLLSRHDLRAVVATTSTNVSYFTGYDCWQYAGFRENMLHPGAPESLVQAYGVLAPGERPALVTTIYNALFPVEEGVEIAPFGQIHEELPAPKRGEEKTLTLLRRLMADQRPSAGDALAARLEEMGVTRGRVGIESSNLSDATRSALKKRLPGVTWLDSTHLIRLVRMVKTDEELLRMRRAAQIAEKAMLSGLSRGRVGGTVDEIRAPYLVGVAEGGALFEHWAFSPIGFGQSDDPAYRFRNNEYCSIDVGCIYRRYYADTGTTLVVGKGNAEANGTYRALWEVLEECRDCLRPGATPSVILETFRKAYERRGLKGVDYQGHGIGLETREHPIISYSDHRRISDQVVTLDTEIPLEEGMVINVETPLNMALRGAHQLEKTYLIGRRSTKELTPKREPVPFTTG